MRIGKRDGVLFEVLNILSLASTAGSSLACSCLAGGGANMREVAASYSNRVSASGVIFEGVVEKQEARTWPIGAPTDEMPIFIAGPYRVVSIQVLRAYRGQAAGTVIVLTGMGYGDCGFDFETGKQYLVYADRIDSERLSTSICTGTSPVEHAGPALRFLRGEKPIPDDLLAPETYYDKMRPQWYGMACGRVKKADGTPLADAQVRMTLIRDEPFPPTVAGELESSKSNGSFCIESIRPGKYLLTAEKEVDDANIRWMGYYPGVVKHSEAVPFEARGGDKLSDLNFTVRKQALFTVTFHITTSDGTSPPLKRLAFSVENLDRDALGYRWNMHEEGDYKLFGVPPGKYLVQTYILPDDSEGKNPVQPVNWQMVRQEVEIQSNSRIELKLSPAN